jgi:hypothetical protein
MATVGHCSWRTRCFLIRVEVGWACVALAFAGDKRQGRRLLATPAPFTRAGSLLSSHSLKPLFRALRLCNLSAARPVKISVLRASYSSLKRRSFAGANISVAALELENRVRSPCY